MAAVSKSKNRILEPHIPNGEKLIESYSTDSWLLAVTDRRVIYMKNLEDDRSEETHVESTLLTSDYITGTIYQRENERTDPTGEVMIGGFMTLIGIGALVVGINSTPVIPLVGLVLLIAGILVLYLSEPDEDGSVSVTLQRAGDVPDKSWSFPQGRTDVPRAISRVVAQNN